MTAKEQDERIKTFLTNMGLSFSPQFIYMPNTQEVRYVIVKHFGINVILTLSSLSISTTINISYYPDKADTPFFRQLLTLSSITLPAKFGINQSTNQVQITASRNLDGLEPVELRHMLDSVCNTYLHHWTKLIQESQHFREQANDQQSPVSSETLEIAASDQNALEQLTQKLSNAKTGAESKDLLKSLDKTTGTALTKILMEYLDISTNTELRLASCKILGEIGDSKAIESLTSCLKAFKDTDLHAAAIEALGNIDDTRSADALVTLLKNYSTHRNISAVTQIVNTLLSFGEVSIDDWLDDAVEHLIQAFTLADMNSKDYAEGILRLIYRLLDKAASDLDVESLRILARIGLDKKFRVGTQVVKRQREEPDYLACGSDIYYEEVKEAVMGSADQARLVQQKARQELIRRGEEA